MESVTQNGVSGGFKKIWFSIFVFDWYTNNTNTVSVEFLGCDCYRRGPSGVDHHPPGGWVVGGVVGRAMGGAVGQLVGGRRGTLLRGTKPPRKSWKMSHWVVSLWCSFCVSADTIYHCDNMLITITITTCSLTTLTGGWWWVVTIVGTELLCYDWGQCNSDRVTSLDWWVVQTANIITRPLAAAPTARLFWVVRVSSSVAGIMLSYYLIMAFVS